MPKLPRDFDIYAYPPPLAPAPAVTVSYGAIAEQVRFTHVSPGGFGDFSALLKLKDARIPRQELGAFSRIALMSPGQTVWQGEITDPELGLEVGNDYEYIKLAALGLGNSMRDDPRDDAYTNQTVQQMAAQQLTSRSAFIPLDQDTSALFPDNPATLFSPVYPGKNMEEVVTDLSTLAGDYMWGVWDHPRNKDTAGFPTQQLQIHQRDTSTIAYTAFPEFGDVAGWRIIPSSERAYNVVKIKYNDPTQNPPVNYATYTDPRIALGTAPFRKRTYARDLSGVSTVTASVAQSIANAYGAQFQNVTNKIEIVLKRLRDAGGNPLPISWCRSDKNILIASLAVRGNPLPLVATAGTNMFYIVQVQYEEQENDAKITLQCDNFVDSVNLQIARLQLQSDTIARQGASTSAVVQTAGSGVTFEWSEEWGGWVTAGGKNGHAVTFAPTVLANAPTSINMTPLSTSNASGVTANSLTQYGAHLFATATANGAGFYIGKGLTVGN